MNSPRTIAFVTGVLFIITYATSIPALLLFGPVLHDPGYVRGAGADNQVVLGAFLEMLLIIANIGTAIVLFPILKRQSEILSLGFITARVIESVFIAVGILSVLSIVTLRQQHAAGSGSDAATLAVAGQSLVAIKDWTFQLGPGFVVGVGNGLILGYLMYRSNLVPRPMAVLGLIGGALICAQGIAVMFGIFEAGSVWQYLATVPEFIWELALGVWLVVKGFSPSPITAGIAPVGGDPALAAA